MTELKAGRELDALTAEKVMGYRAWREKRGEYSLAVAVTGKPGDWLQSRTPDFSTSIVEALKVTTKMRALGWVYCTVQSVPQKTEAPEWDDTTMRVEWWAEFSRYRSPIEATSPHCETPALAICLAALSALSSFPDSTKEGE